MNKVDFDNVSMGNVFRTKGGSKVVVVDVQEHKFVAIRIEDATIGSTNFISYDYEGIALRSRPLNDIVGYWIEPKSGYGFINIFENGSGKFYRTEKEAIKFGEGRIAFYTMKWKEGFGIKGESENDGK